MIARGGEDELSHFWEVEASLSGVTKILASGDGELVGGNLFSLFVYCC